MKSVVLTIILSIYIGNPILFAQDDTAKRAGRHAAIVNTIAVHRNADGLVIAFSGMLTNPCVQASAPVLDPASTQFTLIYHIEEVSAEDSFDSWKVECPSVVIPWTQETVLANPQRGKYTISAVSIRGQWITTTHYVDYDEVFIKVREDGGYTPTEWREVNIYEDGTVEYRDTRAFRFLPPDMLTQSDLRFFKTAAQESIVAADIPDNPPSDIDGNQLTFLSNSKRGFVDITNKKGDRPTVLRSKLAALFQDIQTRTVR